MTPELEANVKLSVTTILARFIATARETELPEEAICAARRHLLDGVGVMIGGSAESSARVSQGYVSEYESSQSCTVLGTDILAAAPLAALANGTAAHALEFEDGHDMAGLHPSVCVIPAAFAAAERANATLGELLTAIVVGYEVACRLTRCCRSRRNWALEPSWHFTTLCGIFGAVGAAAVIDKLSADDVEQSLGLATSFAAGHLLAEQDGTGSKFLQAGWGAQAGVSAVDLVKRGMSAPRGALDRPAGFLPLYVRDFTLESLVDDLGTRYEIIGASIKPYPTCRFTHGVIDAVLSLRSQSEINRSDISRIDIGLPKLSYARVVDPVESRRRPQNIIAARFSAPYVAALAWLRGAVSLDDFLVHFPDTEVLTLAERVFCHVDESLPDTLYAAEVVVRGSDSEFRRLVSHPLGSPEHPLSHSALLTKFCMCASRGLGLGKDDVKIHGLAEIIRSADKAFPVRALTARATRSRANEPYQNDA
ncbi:hypothetical protein C9I57_30585 [Trinickia symbiotica]|uniref:MmgE/PrpD family protein n=1 Tax=Trinickia symbiotica TaxID=863227 RepID=A0A2T3XK53_9BURK|nr:MmgE/PrpD family protein [Trinickia symbiotica]PTB16933.1 hypothetical protein C9I57_30585 [Trinickia symbiotica]